MDQSDNRLIRILKIALAVYALLHIAFSIFLWFNHVNFPLNLDLMEGTVLQHFQRAMTGQPIYPAPTPEYVPLAYNPLYYVLAMPFGAIFGVNLFTLRLVAILGTLGSGVMMFAIVRRKTGSAGWGLMAAGLLAAAYRVMETYLDNAHSDSWLIFTALLGTALIDRNGSRGWNVAGLLVLVASFWFKQHGALFVIGGVLFLTYREGLRRALPYWLVAAALGPGLYLLAGPALFGASFHTFTWEVPRQWSEVNFETFKRYFVFIGRSYPVLAASGGLLTLWTAIKDRARLDVWHAQFVFALLTGVMGTLDAGSANNVYIPMGAWFILVGALGLHALSRIERVQRYHPYLIGLFISLAVMVYNPADVIVSPRAQEAYADFVSLLRGLDGPVYAPWLGQLQADYAFYPAAHWVALEDMIRGPGRDTRNHPDTRRLLDPVLHPNGPAYILTNYPLDYYPFLAFLTDDYTLGSDFGDRFAPLRVLPKRFDHGFPHYLYRFQAH